ncbi:lysosomal acid glucosylceramidase-like isoform X1 [Diabrotica undecimpunctata]|uniref:lysosomal acid glucosylceramidase-like isoform X1 n=1 Tax=Diabrotica undecimpunctata TaxID=50387 RepID=UPI003B6360BB
MVTYIIKIWLVITGFDIIVAEECQSKDYGNGGTVCVCTASSCDFIPPVEKVDSPNCIIYTSNKAGLRFSKSEGTFKNITSNAWNPIFVDRSRTYQTIIGFGGAITDAAGINIKSLSGEAQQNLMNFFRSYFGPDSIEYTMLRVPMGASDFSERLYTYDDSNSPDPELKEFKLEQEDFDYKIPYLQQAMELSGGKLKLLASPWTCPKWMKFIPSFVSMLGIIREDMLQPWANYYIKFLESYKENKLEFWGITTGNEPSVGFTPIPLPSIGFTSGGLSKWVANNLGPTIRDSNYSNIKIVTLDDQRIFLPMFIDDMLANPATRQYVDGIGVHWYFDKFIPTTVLDITHDHHPDKFLLGTEACRGELPWEPKVVLGSWERGEDYATGIVEDLRHWFVGWLDWNIALNLKGGPNIVNNFVDSPILVNATADEFYKQPMFYAMGHFSKFIPQDSVRIEVSYFDPSILTVAFRRPDDGILVNIINLRNDDLDVALVDRRIGQVDLRLTRRSFTSILYW